MCLGGAIGGRNIRTRAVQCAACIVLRQVDIHTFPLLGGPTPTHAPSGAITPQVELQVDGEGVGRWPEGYSIRSPLF